MKYFSGIKQGDSFEFGFTLKDSNKQPLDLETDSIECQVKTEAGVAVETLTVTKSSNPGEYIIASAGTLNWPIGDLETDVKITYNNKTRHSSTYKIPVLKVVTI